MGIFDFSNSLISIRACRNTKTQRVLSFWMFARLRNIGTGISPAVKMYRYSSLTM